MARPRTNRKDRWYLPKTHRYHFMGYCYERNGKAYIYLPNHKRKCLNMPFSNDSKPLALHLLEEHIAQGNTTKERTCGDLWEEYTAVYFGNYSELNCKRYTQTFQEYVDKKAKLSEIGKIRQYVIDKLSSKNFNPNYQHKILQRIRHVFKFAVEEGYIDRNPIMSQLFPKKTQPEPVSFTESEMQNILQGFKEHYPDTYDFIYVIYLTGMRVSEALKLRWKDLHTDHLRIDGKGGVRRSLPLRAFNGLQKTLLKQAHTNEYIFNVGYQELVGKQLERVKKIYGISKGGRFHSIRKYRENKWITEGKNIKIVAQIIGHTTQTQSLHYMSKNTLKELEIGILGAK